MAIDSVNSSTNSQPVRPRVQTEQTRSNEQARKAEQAREEEKARQARQAEQGNKERPVVNTRGQTTGKVVNVTA